MPACYPVQHTRSARDANALTGFRQCEQAEDAKHEGLMEEGLSSILALRVASPPAGFNLITRFSYLHVLIQDMRGERRMRVATHEPYVA